MRAGWVGSLVGAILTVVGWTVLGVEGFGARLLVAFVGFGIGHGAVALVRGRSGEPVPRSAGERRSNVPLYVAGGAAIVILLALAGMMVTRDRQRRSRQEEARREADRLAAEASARGNETTSTSAAASTSAPASAAPARTATIDFSKWAPAVVGPFDASVVQQLADKGFKPAEQPLDWNDVRPEEVGSIAAAPKDLHDLTLRCAEATRDLSALAALSSLHTLALLDCPNVDLASLSKLGTLKELRVYDMPLGSFDFVRPLTALEVLDASASSDPRLYAEIARLTGRAKPGDPLYTMTEMQPLEVVDTSALATLVHLKKLSLSTRAVKDLSPLASLRALASLNLEETPVTDLSPIGSLPALTELWLRGSAASGQVAAFRKAHPKVTVDD